MQNRLIRNLSGTFQITVGALSRLSKSVLNIDVRYTNCKKKFADATQIKRLEMLMNLCSRNCLYWEASWQIKHLWVNIVLWFFKKPGQSHQIENGYTNWRYSSLIIKIHQCSYVLPDPEFPETSDLLSRKFEVERPEICGLAIEPRRGFYNSANGLVLTLLKNHCTWSGLPSVRIRLIMNSA